MADYKLIRRVHKDSKTWHPTTDNLQLTHEYEIIEDAIIGIKLFSYLF